LSVDINILPVMFLTLYLPYILTSVGWFVCQRHYSRTYLIHFLKFVRRVGFGTKMQIWFRHFNPANNCPISNLNSVYKIL